MSCRTPGSAKVKNVLVEFSGENLVAEEPSKPRIHTVIH